MPEETNDNKNNKMMKTIFMVVGVVVLVVAAYLLIAYFTKIWPFKKSELTQSNVSSKVSTPNPSPTGSGENGKNK
ncbi:hypothetical protein EHP00_903 [Ecytonucleospora hepatopenaei]|uniref:Uncharacterized protein n=1 Tax=Ecytonucleospora hepatopenaei TaxID=646526 RepID=A0A1W0E4T3_9MICR|nr:hypothetical protein EHP00_903 [Ecytonucleospora hepatopenaei]